MTIIKINRETFRKNPNARECSNFEASGASPNWLFDYLPTELTCKFCGATFPHTELSDADEYILYQCDDYNMCPNCGESECCEIEYESSHGVAVELGLVHR